MFTSGSLKPHVQLFTLRTGDYSLAKEKLSENFQSVLCLFKNLFSPLPSLPPISSISATLTEATLFITDAVSIQLS